MIITDKFVFLHFHKTGGSFVSEVLKKVHARMGRGKKSGPPLCQELLLPNLKRIYLNDVHNVHGTYEQIPAEHRGKPIFSCIRNPFDRYVSTYEYHRWVRPQPQDWERVKELFPTFPRLTFKQYLSYINEYDVKNLTDHELLKVDIGTITYSFIQFFFRDPRRTIKELDEDYLRSESYRRDMAEVTFLHMENLNQELYDLLISYGYAENDISFIIKEPRINATPQREQDNDWGKYYDQELFELIKHKERFLLKLFPEYAKPNP